MSGEEGASRGFRVLRALLFLASLAVDALLLLYAVELISHRNGDGILIWSMNQPRQVLANFGFLFFLLLGMAALLRPRRGIRLTHIFALVLSTVSYFKLDYRGEPLLLTDFMQAKEGLAIAGKLRFSPPGYMILAWAALLFAVPLLFPKRRLPLPRAGRLSLSAAAFAGFFLCLSWGVSLPLTPTYQYKFLFEENGFFLGLAETRPRQELTRPEDYSRQRILEILGDAAKAPAERAPDAEAVRPDIFFIMSESLFDLAGETDLSFSRDPLEGLHALMGEGIGAHAITPGYGGGTFYSEYEVLTGYRAKDTPTRIYYDSQVIQPGMKSVARTLSDAGYRTAAIHPNTGTFYNRERSYQAMGFERLYFSGELGKFETRVGPFPSDHELFQKTLAIYEKDREGDDAPRFYHIVTYQNHGSYNYRYGRRDIRIDNLADEDTKNSAENYANAVLTHVEALTEFIDCLRDSPRPVLVVLWGDHAPAVRFLGANLPDAAAARARFYTTPLFIWNNYGADYAWGEAYTATYRLGARVLALLGMGEDPYFRYLSESDTPDMVTALHLLEKDGRFFADEEAYSQLDRDLLALHYDRLIGERYEEEAP